MKTSDTIEKLSTAFVAAQAELKNAVFDKTNPHFKSKYATLAGMRDGLVATLSKHGLAVIQGSDVTEAGPVVNTRLVHTSGQWIESAYPIAMDKPQQMGSAVTYARRYSLAAICGIASEEDDDGNAAQNGNTPVNANGTVANPLKRDEARKIFTELKAELLECNTDAEVMAWERTSKARIDLLGDWKVHIENAVAEHRQAIADAQGKAA